jgi:hypothetical protein
MKNILSLGALLGAALFVVAGCSSTPEDSTELNTYFQPKTGDTFTYARYDRDMDNQRVQSSKTMHKWVVLQTGLSYQGKTSVSKILQLNYDSTGTVPSGTADTVYIRTGADGEIFMNVISATVARIPIAAQFASAIPFTWVKVTDTKTSVPMTWSAIAGNSVVTDVTLPGLGVPGRVIISDTAYHKGKTGATIDGNAYGNAFHTDHTMKMMATLLATGTRIIDNDSLHMAYDFDINNGLLRQAMSSDSITANLPGGATAQAVNGFEFVLVSAVRAK